VRIAVEGQAAPAGDNLDRVAHAEQIVDIRREIDQQPGMLAGDDAFRPLRQPAGHHGAIAGACQVMERKVSVRVRVRDRNARLDVIARPAEGRVADAGVVGDTRHARQDAGDPRGIRRVPGITEAGLADLPRHCDFDQVLRVSC